MGQALEKTVDFTPEAYLAWEAEQFERHEYLNGEVFLMTGTTTAHNLIAGNLAFALKQALRGQPCRVFMSDVKLRVETANCFFYPDVMVTCSARDRGESKMQFEPTVVVEVLSDSTAAYDQGLKFEVYRQLPSLREYVLIAQDEPRVWVYRRGEGAEWILHPYRDGETVVLPSLELAIPLADLYQDL